MQRWNLLLHDILRTAASAVSEESWQKEKEAGREELGLRAEGGKGGGGGGLLKIANAGNVFTGNALKL